MKTPNFIKLSAVTSKGAAVIHEHGDIWKVQGRVENPRPDYFKSRKNQLYVTPSPKPSRNSREDIGENYLPPTHVPNVGARWIAETNDSDFEWTEHKFGRN